MTTEIPPTEHTGQTAVHAEKFSMCFTSTPRGAHLARRLASHRLGAWGFPYESEVNETATLVVAELTANAVTHGRVPGRDFRLSLALAVARDLVRIEVTDARDGGLSPTWPCAPQDAEAEEGRGL